MTPLRTPDSSRLARESITFSEKARRQAGLKAWASLAFSVPAGRRATWPSTMTTNSGLAPEAVACASPASAASAPSGAVEESPGFTV